MPINLRDLLADGKVHVLDGAMGTMLYSKGFFLNVCYDELNLKQPKLVQEVHEAYVRAGAEILETNTFGANPVKLGSYGPAGRPPGARASSAPSGRLAFASSPSARRRAKRRSRTFSARCGALSRAAWTVSSWRRFLTWTRSTRRCERCGACPTSR